MNNASSYLDTDVDYRQFHESASVGVNGRSSSDLLYTEEPYHYTTGAGSEQHVDYNRHGSFSSGGDLYEEHGSGTSTPVFHCSLCGWTTASSDHFDYHNRAHDGECLFQCFLDGCEAAFSQADDLVAHSRSRTHRRQVLSGQSAAPKRSWHQPDSYQYSQAPEVDQWIERTPQKPSKRVCVEPITPITPSTTFTSGNVGQAAAVAASISRRLSYEDALPQPPPPQKPAFLRQSSHHNAPCPSLTYEQPFDDISTASASPSKHRTASQPIPTFTLPAISAPPSTFVLQPTPPIPATQPFSRRPSSATTTSNNRLLASPLPITASAPLDRGCFDPYPQVASSSMSLAHSLPHPAEQFQTPQRSRTIHTRRREQQEATQGQGQDEYYSPPQTLWDQKHHFLQQQQRQQSPVSPAPPPALVPMPNSSYAAAPTPSRRGSSASVTSHSSEQAVLLSAASMNRLFARLPTPTQQHSSCYAPHPQAQTQSRPTSPLAPPFDSSLVIHPRYRDPPPVSPRAERLDKVYECGDESCGRRFKRLEHLRRHERTHTMEKPYGCDIPGCDRFFRFVFSPFSSSIFFLVLTFSLLSPQSLGQPRSASQDAPEERQDHSRYGSCRRRG